MEVSSTCRICNKFYEALTTARASNDPAELLAIKEQHQGHLKSLEVARKAEAYRRRESGRGDDGAPHTNAAFDVMDSKKTELPWFKTAKTRNAIKGLELMAVKVRPKFSPPQSRCPQFTPSNLFLHVAICPSRCLRSTCPTFVGSPSCSLRGHLKAATSYAQPCGWRY